MQKSLRHIILFLGLFINSIGLFSQDVEQVAKADPLKVTGGFNATTGYYEAWGMDARMDPFSWSLNANLNFNFFGVVNAPFSAHITKGNKTYSQPEYNQIGISPKYKWITAHIGYRSMQFSSYSLSGMLFLGGGIEVAPPKSIVKVSAMYGKFANAIPYDTGVVATSGNLFDAPGYERWGGGTKISVGKGGNNVDLIIFKAKDDPNSIPDPPIESGITPKENLVTGIATKNTIHKNIVLTTEYTLSALTRDIRLEERTVESYSYINNVGKLFTPRFSTTFNKVICAGLQYNGEGFTFGGSYKRVDPDYQSLGTTYLSNDIEDIMANISKTFYQNKINLTLNGGRQRNNLEDQLKVTNVRFIAGIGVAYAISNQWNIAANYSNFNSNTAPEVISFVDSFKFVQVTQNASFNANYSFGETDIKHSLMLNTAYQNVNSLNETATLLQETGSNMVNTNIGYTLNITPSALMLSGSFNYNRFSQMEGVNSNTYGPTVNVNKGLLDKKITVTFSSSLLNSGSSGQSSLMNLYRAAASYKPGKHHALSLSSSFMIKQTETTDETINSREFRGGFTYGFVF